jgi:hypothetical protein
VGRLVPSPTVTSKVAAVLTATPGIETSDAEELSSGLGELRV